MKTRTPWLAALVCSTSLVLALPTPAGAQLTVYDPTNYASNVMQAARALEQINNQVRGLQNQALSLTNQARNLAQDRKSTRLNSSHVSESRMPSSA